MRDDLNVEVQIGCVLGFCKKPPVKRQAEDFERLWRHLLDFHDNADDLSGYSHRAPLCCPFCIDSNRRLCHVRGPDLRWGIPRARKLLDDPPFIQRPRVAIVGLLSRARKPPSDIPCDCEMDKAISQNPHEVVPNKTSNAFSVAENQP